MPQIDRDFTERANEQLRDSTPHDVLGWAAATFGDSFCVTTSLVDAVLVEMASRVRPGVHVVFVDTGYHFEETLRTRDELVARYPVTLVEARPMQSVPAQDSEFGPRLHERDAELCCTLRKVRPFNEALSGYQAWASGLRRDESPTRRNVERVEWDEPRGMVKVNPLCGWTQDEVDGYVERNNVLVNPLVRQSYPSIGCAPCTRPVSAGEHPRSGRWAGLEKTECGLHLTPSSTGP